MNAQGQHDGDLIAEACEWAAVIAMGDIDEPERRRFEAWLDTSPEHANAYRETCAALDHPMFSAAIAQAAHDASEASARVPNRPSLSAIAASLISRLRTLPMGVTAGALAAAAIMIMLSVSFLQVTPFTPADGPSPQQLVTAEYSTTGIETREISFPDGSVATLGARSAVAIAFSADERRVTLLEGEGYFAVTPDTSRPFIVQAGDAAIRAVGTAFDVRLAASSVRVDVVEGEVRVRSPAPAEVLEQTPELPAISMTAMAGERLIFEPESGLMKRATPPHAELAAWRTGRLEYFGEALNRVVADANRYYDGDIKIASDEIGSMKVTATFPTSSVGNIFELLAEQVPIAVSKAANGDIVLSASDG